MAIWSQIRQAPFPFPRSNLDRSQVILQALRLRPRSRFHLKTLGACSHDQGITDVVRPKVNCGPSLRPNGLLGYTHRVLPIVRYQRNSPAFCTRAEQVYRKPSVLRLGRRRPLSACVSGQIVNKIYRLKLWRAPGLSGLCSG